MLPRAQSGSVVCPSCGSLVGVRDEQCLRCGRRNPGLFGFGPALRRLGADFGVGGLLLGVCIALYAISLAIDPAGIFSGGPFSFLGPSQRALLVLGASGWTPVVGFGHWWTLLTAGWLHGGLLHIGLNGLWMRQFAGQVVSLYGPGRTLILFVIGSAVGFLASTLGVYAPGPIRTLMMGNDLRLGATLTIGASAGLLAFLGAIFAWAQRTGNRYATSQILSSLAMLAVFGFMARGVVDNWAHLGGFLGGWGLGRWLDPLTPERGDHLLIGLGLLALTVVAFAVNIVTTLRMLG